MLIELPIMITQFIEKEERQKLFSFNDFVTIITSELHNIRFKILNYKKKNFSHVAKSLIYKYIPK